MQTSAMAGIHELIFSRLFIIFPFCQENMPADLIETRYTYNYLYRYAVFLKLASIKLNSFFKIRFIILLQHVKTCFFIKIINEQMFKKVILAH